MTKTNILCFAPELAAVIGLNEAIVLNQIHYWIQKNKKQGVNLREGRIWTYSSYNNWQEQFSFWSERTVRRALNSLEEKGLLISNRFNKMRYDQTKWYTIPYESIPYEILSILTDDEDIADSGAGQSGQGQLVRKDSPIQENNKKNNKESVSAHVYDDSKTAYGEYKWVRLSDDEVTDLIARYGSELTARAIQHIDRQVEKTGNRYGWTKWKPVIQQAIDKNWGGIVDDIQ